MAYSFEYLFLSVLWKLCRLILITNNDSHTKFVIKFIAALNLQNKLLKWANAKNRIFIGKSLKVVNKMKFRKKKKTEYFCIWITRSILFNTTNLIVESGKKLKICSKNCPTTLLLSWFFSSKIHLAFHQLKRMKMNRKQKLVLMEHSYVQWTVTLISHFAIRYL